MNAPDDESDNSDNDNNNNNMNDSSHQINQVVLNNQINKSYANTPNDLYQKQHKNNSRLKRKPAPPRISNDSSSSNNDNDNLLHPTSSSHRSKAKYSERKNDDNFMDITDNIDDNVDDNTDDTILFNQSMNKHSRRLEPLNHSETPTAFESSDFNGKERPLRRLKGGNRHIFVYLYIFNSKKQMIHF